MPIYQFKCPECGHKDEALMKYIDPCLICKKCEIVMEKIFPTGTSFKLKGEGWYKDGYSKSSKKEKKSSEKSNSKSNSKSSES